MAYDPADLKLPKWALLVFDHLVGFRVPVYPGWRVGLTRPGLLFSSTLLGVIGASLYSGNNLLYLCASMLFCIAVSAFGAGIWLIRSVPRLQPFLPEVGHDSRALHVREAVGLRFPFSASLHARWQRHETVVRVVLRVEEDRGWLTATLPSLKRGLYRFQGHHLATDAPLGLWAIEAHRPESWQLMILPSPEFWDDRGGSTGGGPIRGSLEGDEWHDLRSYVRGDSPARIHWRKSTFGDWTVKRFTNLHGCGQAALLRVDLRSPNGIAFERLLARTYGWILRHPDGVLVLGQQTFELGDPDQHWHALQALALAEPEEQPAAGRGGLLITARVVSYAA